MFASKLPVLPICVALTAQMLAACALIEPVSPDAQLPEHDAGPNAEFEGRDFAHEQGDEREAESASDLLANAPGIEASPAEHPLAADASAPLAPEPAQLTADGGQENAGDAQANCEADWQCAATEVCSRVRRACVPHCQGETCLGPTISDTNDRLVSDGARVCFADDSEAPGSGDFALRTWDGLAPRAITLTRAQGVRAVLLDSYYCYFHAAGALRRAGLSGGCVELVQEMAEPPLRIASDGGHVSWSAAGGSYRIAPQQNARAERVETVADLPSGENVFATSARVGDRVITRHALEVRLQAAPVVSSPDHAD